MSEERDEGPITTEETDSSFEQIEGGPISIDVTDNQDAIGEVSVTEPQEEKVQEQKLQSREGVQEESRIGKGKQKRRITS